MSMPCDTHTTVHFRERRCRNVGCGARMTWAREATVHGRGVLIQGQKNRKNETNHTRRNAVMPFSNEPRHFALNGKSPFEPIALMCHKWMMQNYLEFDSLADDCSVASKLFRGFGYRFGFRCIVFGEFWPFLWWLFVCRTSKSNEKLPNTNCNSEDCD